MYYISKSAAFDGRMNVLMPRHWPGRTRLPPHHNPPRTEPRFNKK